MRWHKPHKWSYSLPNKTQTRNNLLAVRSAIPVSKRDSAALSASHLFMRSHLFNSSQSIAGYFSQENEFDCLPMIQVIWQAKKNCYLPVLSTLQENFLEFVLYNLNDPLNYNRYRILEPINENKLSASQLDLVLIPLVGFDLQGNRLGMGGGYYDRTFEFMRGKTLKKPYLLGLAYELQKVSALPYDSWDVPLDGVLTEERIYLFK